MIKVIRIHPPETINVYDVHVNVHNHNRFLIMYQQRHRDRRNTETKVCHTCVCPDVLYVVALAVGEIGALAAGVQFAGKVIPQVFPPVVLTDSGVWTQSALKHPAETQQQRRRVYMQYIIYYMEIKQGVKLLFTAGRL